MWRGSLPGEMPNGGMFCTLHHMCQTEWESAAEGREAHGSKKMCAYHHPFLTNHPSCSTSTLHKAAAPSAGASALRTVPRYDAAKYPGVEAVAAAMNDAMARWKMMPGPVEWCGASFEGMRHGVYLQMVVNGVHLQHKRGAKGKIWKDFYEQTVGIQHPHRVSYTPPFPLYILFCDKFSCCVPQSYFCNHGSVHPLRQPTGV